MSVIMVPFSNLVDGNLSLEQNFSVEMTPHVLEKFLQVQKIENVVIIQLKVNSVSSSTLSYRLACLKANLEVTFTTGPFLSRSSS